MSVEIMDGRNRRKKYRGKTVNDEEKKQKNKKKEPSGQVSSTNLPHYNKL